MITPYVMGHVTVMRINLSMLKLKFKRNRPVNEAILIYPKLRSAFFVGWHLLGSTGPMKSCSTKFSPSMKRILLSKGTDGERGKKQMSKS